MYAPVGDQLGRPSFIRGVGVMLRWSAPSASMTMMSSSPANAILRPPGDQAGDSLGSSVEIVCQPAQARSVGVDYEDVDLPAAVPREQKLAPVRRPTRISVDAVCEMGRVDPSAFTTVIPPGP